MDEIKILLNSQENIDIFCLSETFLTNEFSDAELNIPNYDCARKDRQSHGGGLIIYTKSNLPCSCRYDLEINHIEMLWLEVRHNKQKPFLICYCYRPPSATSEWTEKSEQSIDIATSEDKEIILLGDFNFNMLSVKAWLRKTEYLNLIQLVQNPTRVTNSTETIIDHVYSNMPDNITHISVPFYAISDHYPVCVTRKITNFNGKGPVHKFISYRETKSFNEANFIYDLESQPWSIMSIFDNASDALDYFTNLFNSVLNKHAPKKKRRVKRSKQPNWINPEILSAIKKRDSYHKDKNMEQYCLWRNKVKTLIQSSKSNFYSESISNNHNNPKQLWQNLHDVTNLSTKQQTSFINDENGNPILDPEDTANKFNNFFTSLHKNLTLRNTDQTFNSTKIHNFVHERVPCDTEFSLPSVNISFIQKQLQNLKVNKATGIDELSAKFLKLSASVISQPLATILNLSIQNGTYPDALKKAKVTLIFKKGERSDINNYRPISVLPVITGIFERHVSSCLISFLETYKLVYEHQSGFRRHHSCQTSLTEIVDKWLTALNNNETVGTVFLDLSKAFDLVNHQLLLQKLAAYKFSSSTLSWFDSYLKNRYQQVSISGKLSSCNQL